MSPSVKSILVIAVDIVQFIINTCLRYNISIGEEGLRRMLLIVSEGINSLGTNPVMQLESLQALNQLAILAFKIVGQGQVLQLSSHGISMAMAWSTKEAPVKGTGPFIAECWACSRDT